MSGRMMLRLDCQACAEQTRVPLSWINVEAGLATCSRCGMPGYIPHAELEPLQRLQVRRTLAHALEAARVFAKGELPS